MNPICKLCTNEATLIKAHIIPRSFWEIDASQPPPRMVTNTQGVFPKKIPIGVYDQTLLCEPCERCFNDCDGYAAQLFLKRFNEFEEVHGSNRRLTGYVLGNVHYRLLKLFAIALLWRASVSSHSFFSNVRLGPFEEKAREMLVRGDPGDAATFGTLFSVWDGAESLIMDPFAERWDSVRSYRFYLGRFVAYIKVDSRPFPEPLARAALTPEGPLHVISRQLERSQDLRVAEHVFAYEIIRRLSHMKPELGPPDARPLRGGPLEAHRLASGLPSKGEPDPATITGGKVLRRRRHTPRLAKPIRFKPRDVSDVIIADLRLTHR